MHIPLPCFLQWHVLPAIRSPHLLSRPYVILYVRVGEDQQIEVLLTLIYFGSDYHGEIFVIKTK